ncbi:MAG: DUF6502 family protein [Cocleimonas sp.]
MATSLHTVLSKAVIHILKPLVKVLMRNDVSHASFTALAKQAYVDVAYKHFSIPNKKMTYSRVAVLTGLNRKEVVRLSKTGNSTDLSGGTPNRAIRVVNGWLNDPEFLDKNKDPLVLNIKGDGNSFATLVSRYSGDITRGAIIDELERLGIAKKINSEQIFLNQKGYIPESGEIEKIDILSTCTSDLLSSAVHNLEHGKDDGRFQRQLVYKNVPTEIAAQFQEISTQKSSALLIDLNKWLGNKLAESKHYEIQSTNDNDIVKTRVGLGIYYFENKSDKES